MHANVCERFLKMDSNAVCECPTCGNGRDMGHDIFISYSRKNKDAVLPIKEEIERTLGLRCWIDLSDIPCGAENFKKKVIPGIRQSRLAFLFFLSVESQDSEYAMKEVNFAKKRAKKRVILVRFNDDEMTDEFFFDYQDADIIDWRKPEQKAKLIRDLQEWHGGQQADSKDTTQHSGGLTAAVQTLVVCSMCGKKNDPRDTFKCRACGRDNLCLRHQDETTFLCKECMAESKRDLASSPEKRCCGNDHEISTCDNSVDVNEVCSGKVIGGFKMLDAVQAHAGAQGAVYRALCVEDRHGLVPKGTIVALKIMAVQDEGKIRWRDFVKHASELSKLNHPNVVRYFGGFRERSDFTDLHVVVQEFLKGETLKDRLARSPDGLDADESVKIVDSALAGLSYTASRGLVHRDVKPGNIFLSLNAEGAIESVKLIDFELSKREDETVTCEDNIKGTFDYLAPDFLNSKFYGDEQSDVFSMGVVLHETLTGKTPYPHIAANEKQATFVWLSRWSNVLSGDESPVKVHGRVKRLLAHGDEVLARALAVKREDRYKNFAEFREGLKRIRLRSLRNGKASYQFLQFAGRGEFGEVFKARHMESGRIVAIKHLLKANYEDRFSREAKILEKIDDSCCVRFIDYFVLDHVGGHEVFLVMDFLPGMPGSSLRDAIRHANGTGLPYRETLLAFTRFAHGLSVLHSKGFVHRDIKPSNLYWPEGHPERAAIMDLAIALDTSDTITSGAVPGTLDYMPPELVLGKSRGSSASDIYALGLSLYEALTGKTAYPRLSQGADALLTIVARARNAVRPDFADPIVAWNAALHDLLVQMTHPDLSKRLVDAGQVESRLFELANAEMC